MGFPATVFSRFSRSCRQPRALLRIPVPVLLRPIFDLVLSAMAAASPLTTDSVSPPVEPAAISAPAPDAQAVECIAKVIMHEAAYEPWDGRVAVAQVIRHRVSDGRFGADPCDVARQRGQFFDVDAFRPARDSAAWGEAVRIATAALTTDGEEVAPGALFFHAAYSPMPGHAPVTRIGGHVFYR